MAVTIRSLSGELSGNGVQDLVTPDGIQLGVGDGTFESTVVWRPARGERLERHGNRRRRFWPGGLPDIAFTETSPDGPAANLCVLQNDGNDKFQLVDTFPVDLQPQAIQAIDLGNGTVDLAVADDLQQAMWRYSKVTGTEDSRRGRFSMGVATPWRWWPASSMLGHVDLIVADQGDHELPEQARGSPCSRTTEPGQFRLAATIPLASCSLALAAGDFGNGNLDLAIARLVSMTTFPSFWVTATAPSSPHHRFTPWEAIPWPSWPRRFETTVSSTW